MINRVEFQDITNNFSVVATYTTLFELDYGTIETSSEIGILSQESRSVNFKLILDSFLEELVFNKEMLLKYRIVLIDNNDNSEFIGFLKEDGGIKIDKNENTVAIEIVDMFYFIKDAGDLTNESKLSISNKTIIPAALVSGLKKRIPWGNNSGAPLYSARSVFKIWAYSDNFFLNKGYKVSSNEISPKMLWWSVIGDWEMEWVWQRVKVITGAGTEEYYTENPTGGIYQHPFLISDENKEMVSEFITGIDGESSASENSFRWIWIDKENPFNVPDSALADIPNGAALGSESFIGYYCYVYDFDITEPILSSTLVVDATYSPIGNTSAFSTENREFWFCDYKSKDIDNFAYWVNVTNRPHSCRVYVYEAGQYAYYYDNVSDSTEVMFQVDGKTKDMQQAVFVDYALKSDVNGEYVEIYLHYLLKAWGIGSNQSDISAVDDFKTSCYGYRKRTLKFRGYQLFDDNWDNERYTYAQMPPMVYVAGSWDWGGTRQKEGVSGESNYTINDHFNQYKKLYRFSYLADYYPAISDYLNNASSELYNSKAVFWCRYDSSSEPYNGQLTVNGRVNLIIESQQYGKQIYGIHLSGFDTDLGSSGLGAPSAPYYRNTVNIRIFYTGAINLTAYVYDTPYNLADAAKLVMTSNLFALIDDSKNSKLKLVNKVPIDSSVVYTSSDVIDLEVTNTLADRYDDSIYDVILLESRDVLNKEMSYFINTTLNRYDVELQFTYSNIFSGITPEIGDNFDYDGVRYSVVSVGRKSENIFDIRAIKNGISTFKFSNDGTTILDAELSNDGITMIEWNMRTV